MTLPTHMDIWRNRFPLKHAADLLSISAIAMLGDRVWGEPLNFRNRLARLRFYFTSDNVTRLHACLPRAGAPALDSTLSFQHAIPILRIRSARLKTMKTVVFTRSIFDSLESRYFKLASLKNHPNVSTDDDSGFDWEGVLREYIAFFNSWGDVLSWHPTIRHYKYEDLKSDPVGLHKEILDFWGFDVPIDCVAEGFRRASKSEMRKRMPVDSIEPNFRAVSRNETQRNSFSPERKKWLIERLNKGLSHPLGYTYDENTEYGRAYD